jgi:hypothetical protein
MIALVNESTEPSLSLAFLQQVADAVERQLEEHYAAFWESAGCTIVACASLADAPKGAAIVAVMDNADQADALGYHATTPDGRPYARVFVRPILDNGGTVMTGPVSVSVTISHEVLEMWGDPYANFWADASDGNEYALELCDAVEGDAYEIDGISVSNFVGPRWFDPGGAGPFDWMRTLSAPFTMSAGGYMILRTSSGDVRQVFGSSFPAWKLAGKAHPAARSQKRIEASKAAA